MMSRKDEKKAAAKWFVHVLARDARTRGKAWVKPSAFVLDRTAHRLDTAPPPPLWEEWLTDDFGRSPSKGDNFDRPLIVTNSKGKFTCTDPHNPPRGKLHESTQQQHRPGTTLDNLTRARAHPTTARGWQLPMRGRGGGRSAGDGVGGGDPGPVPTPGRWLGPHRRSETPSAHRQGRKEGILGI